MREQFIGFCNDGASCIIDEYLAVATLHKAKCPFVKSFHCMTHRLEIDLTILADDVNALSHFRTFDDAFYKVYSLPPKKS